MRDIDDKLMPPLLGLLGSCSLLDSDGPRLFYTPGCAAHAKHEARDLPGHVCETDGQMKHKEEPCNTIARTEQKYCERYATVDVQQEAASNTTLDVLTI